MNVAAWSFQAWNDHVDVKIPSLSVYVPAACPAGTAQDVVTALATPALKERGLLYVCHTFVPLLL